MISSFVLNFIKRRGVAFYKAGVTDKTSINYRKIFDHFKIDTLLDVGANEGQYAMAMKKWGYSNKIVSFEPVEAVYKKLSANTREGNNWEAINIALGDKDGEEYINVSQNTVSSSLLEMLPAHVKQEAGSAYITKEKITVRKLDSIFNTYSKPGSSVYLKLDVQGFEKNVIEGASDSLKNIKLIQLEMAIVPLYKGELLLADMINYMNGKGFVLYNLIPGFNNFETGQQFQTDGIFVRNDLV
ncbi:MAG: FkbM family methyltransferase [Bacteroidetes bacterium]|nr:FkbM family methyltransferase [Bacteroidota bacterium]